MYIHDLSKLQAPRHNPMKYAFLSYKNPKDAENAVNSMQGKIIFDQVVGGPAPRQCLGDQSAVRTPFANPKTKYVSSFCRRSRPWSRWTNLKRRIFPFPLVSVSPFILPMNFSESRVMWDPNTSRSRGYGFVSFKEKSDAEKAIVNMNGVLVGRRPIRVNWASHKFHDSDT